jgi:hypothetical protein
MKGRVTAGLVVLLGALALAGLLRGSETGQAQAEPLGFASPINGGCYIAAPNVCKIHIDPFTININDGAGARLMLFQLYANGSLIYDFRTDVSNPPGADYSPSLVMQDFAAECGESYVVNMLAQDTSDANPLNYGQTTEFTCPGEVP